jgi:hypothetical protein
MSEEQKQVSAVSKKQKKVIEQWAETKDPFVNALYKRLRNGQKKLTKIEDVESKIRSKEIQPTQEQIDMVQRKGTIKAEMDEVLGYLNIYKESFPENPAFATAGKKKKADAPVSEPVKVEAVAAPVVDVNNVVEEALSLVADAVIFGSIRGVSISGSNNNINEAITHLTSAWKSLNHGTGSWGSAKSNFVETFSRLINKSGTQVAHSSKSYSDINTFITSVPAGEVQTLLSKERVSHHHKHAHKEEAKVEEKHVTIAEPVASAQATPTPTEQHHTQVENASPVA